MDDDEVTLVVADDDLTAVLEHVRQRHFWALAPHAGAITVRASLDDLPSLVAAVEAVLKPHQPGPVTILGALCKRHENHRFFSVTRTEADDVRACPDCAATVWTSCVSCGPQVSADACLVREVITAALAGRLPGDVEKAVRAQVEER